MVPLLPVEDLLMMSKKSKLSFKLKLIADDCISCVPSPQGKVTLSFLLKSLELPDDARHLFVK